MYQGNVNTALNKLAYDRYGRKRFYSVGNNGLIVNFTEDYAWKLDDSLSYDLNSISIYGNDFWIGANGYEILGNHNVGFDYSVNPDPTRDFKDVLMTYSTNYAVGNSYYYSNSNTKTVNERPNYNYGKLNANCISSRSGVTVGTDHGIFIGKNDEKVLEWQPSSGDYNITAFWSEYNSPTNFYACGTNGVLLKTTGTGGITKPFYKLILPGGCTNKSTYMSGVGGSVNSAAWYVDDQYLRSGTSYYYGNFEKGIHKVEVRIQNPAGLKDTLVEYMNIVDVPRINLPIQVNDSVLCQNGTIELTLDSTESQTIYSIYNLSDNDNYGGSSISMGGQLQFNSSVINSTSKFYLKASSSVASCFKDFTDTVQVIVEKTEARYHTGLVNALSGESVDFYENCTDAKHYSWEFSDNAFTKTSVDSIVVNEFNFGETAVNLKCWSEDGCIDSISGSGPTIYLKTNSLDTCWYNLNSGMDGTWGGWYPQDIACMNPSQTGYLICGYTNGTSLATQLGDSLRLNNSGGYAAKYSNEGTLKWVVSLSFDSKNYQQRIKSVNEDNIGNVYLTGYGKGYFTDNTGDSILISDWNEVSYLIKLDNNGRILWYLLEESEYIFKSIYFDKKNNPVLEIEFDGLSSYAENLSSRFPEGIPIKLNEMSLDTLGKFSINCNHRIIKFSPKGRLIWDFGINSKETNGSDIASIGFDASNNIFITGHYEYNSSLYSVGSNTSTYLSGNSQAGGILFLAKYNENGQRIWNIKSMTVGISNPNTRPYDMVVDEQGNCFISGSNDCKSNTYSQIFYNTNGSQITTNKGKYFVARINTNGMCEWIQGVSNSYYGYGYKVALDNDELSVLGEVFNGNSDPITVAFSSRNSDSITITMQRSDYFVAVYDFNGNIKRIHANDNDESKLFFHENLGFFRSDNGTYYSARNVGLYGSKSDYENFGTIIPSMNGREGVVTKFSGYCGRTLYPNLITSLDLLGQNKNVNIYPNPSTDYIVIKGIAANSNNVKIYNATGELLISTVAKDKIDIGRLSPGMYIIRISNNNEIVHTSKLIKQ